MRKAFLYIVIFFFGFAAGFGFVIKSDPDTVDFGKIPFNTVAAAKRCSFTNNLNRAFVGKYYQIFQTTDSLFVLNSKPPLKINAGTKLDIELTFKSKSAKAGIHHAILVIFNAESIEDTAIVYLKAEVLAPEQQKEFEMSVPALTGKTGVTINIPVIASKFTYDQRIKGYEGYLEFNNTILTAANPEQRTGTEFGRQIVKFTGDFSNSRFASGDTLFVLPVITMLGNAEQTTISLVGFRWTGELANVNFKINLVPGSFKLEDIYFENGIPRLTTLVSNVLKIQSDQLAFNKDFSFDVFYDSNAQLKIIDILGNQIVNLSSFCPAHTEYKSEPIPVQRSVFPANGTYVIVLMSKDKLVSRLLIIE